MVGPANLLTTRTPIFPKNPTPGHQTSKGIYSDSESDDNSEKSISEDSTAEAEVSGNESGVVSPLHLMSHQMSKYNIIKSLFFKYISTSYRNIIYFNCISFRLKKIYL